MALNFSNLKGQAEKGSFERFKPAFGINRMRMIGDIMPMYSYWCSLADGTGKVPVECLGFDREKERFTNIERDIVRETDPAAKCGWSYKGLVLDREDGRVKVFDHKKKLLAAIIKFAEKKLGDPTDVVTGWDVVFEKVKTGPHAYNVEYNLEIYEIEPSELTEDEKVLITEHAGIDSLFPRPTYDTQAEFFNSKILNDEEEVVPEELADDLS